MVHILHSPWTPEPNHPISMDLHEIRPSPHSIISSRTPSIVLSPNRYIFHHVPHGKLYRSTLCMGSPCSLTSFPLVCSKKGQAIGASIGLCEVVWILEADLDAGQVLYLTGDPTVLGGWEPDMAVLMSPIENENLWTAKVKIASGVNFRYNYFIETGRESSCDIICRPGPVISLLVPSSLNRKITVRDSWTMSNINKHDYAWGSWIEEKLPPQPLISTPALDEKKFAESSFKVEKSFLDVKDKPDVCKELVTIASKDLDHGTLPSEINQPVEEPWLIRPSTTLLLHRDNQKEVSGSIENVENPELIFDIPDENHQTESLLTEEGIFPINAEPVSTMILINSSICTMQRIAVLEDQKLVELLLEPVKSNVQCDSVYLGAITKLVPHMGGAFVNIGSSRHSFMDTKPYRRPFIFPPFRERLEQQETDGFIVQNLEESLHSHCETEDGPYRAKLSLDDPGQFVPEDYEHEIDDEVDISEILDENLNGTMAGFGEVEMNFVDYLDGEEQHTEGKTINGSRLEIEDSKSFQMSNISDIKDSNHALASENRWARVRKGTKIIVQVVKEGLGTKGPTLTAYPRLRSRFWILISSCNRIGISKKISGMERTRLRVIAKTLQPKGFGLTVRTVATGRSLEELQKDLDGLLSTWKTIVEDAKSAALAADEGVEGAIPVLLHRAMGQTLSVVQDYFNDKVKKMVVDSPRTYHEVTNYLQEIAPDLCDRVELYDKRIPLFDLYKIEEEINNMLSKRVPLPNGGSLVIEQTEALVSVDVNGGHGMFGEGASQEKAILDVNLAAARQIAREIRLRDIGGIIVVDFIDMSDESNKRLVYEEIKKAVERDRSLVKVSELSRHGLMEITRKRVRPSVTFMISEPCSCCHATGRVEALETSFSKIEQEICRLLAKMDRRPYPENPKSWPRFVLRVENHMSNYLTSGKRTKLAILSSSLKVWILLKVARHFTRGTFEVKPFTEETTNQRRHQVAISLLRKAESGTEVNSQKVTLIPIKKSNTGGKRA